MNDVGAYFRGGGGGEGWFTAQFERKVTSRSVSDVFRLSLGLLARRAALLENNSGLVAVRMGTCPGCHRTPK